MISLVECSTYSSSASRASFASGMTDMLMMSPPHCLYICDSALVENAGPDSGQLCFPVQACRRHRLTLHTDYGLVGVKLGRSLSSLQDLLHSRRNKLVQFLAERVPEHRMYDQSLSSEESIFPDTFGSIDDLIRDYEMPRLNLLSQ